MQATVNNLNDFLVERLPKGNLVQKWGYSKRTKKAKFWPKGWIDQVKEKNR